MVLSAVNKATEDGRAAMQNPEDLFDLKALGENLKKNFGGKNEEKEEQDKNAENAYWLAWASICETIAIVTKNKNYIKWSYELTKPQARTENKTAFRDSLFKFKDSTQSHLAKLIETCLDKKYLSRSQLDEIMFKTMLFSSQMAFEKQKLKDNESIEEASEQDEDQKKKDAAKLQLRPFLNFFNFNDSLYCCFTNQELTDSPDLRNRDVQRRFEECTWRNVESINLKLDYEHTFTVDSVISNNNYYHYYNHWLFEKMKDFDMGPLTFDQGTFCCALLFYIADVANFKYEFSAQRQIEAFLQVCQSFESFPQIEDMPVDDDTCDIVSPAVAMWTWLCSKKETFELVAEEQVDESNRDIEVFDETQFSDQPKTSQVLLGEKYFRNKVTTMFVDLKGKRWSQLWDEIKEAYQTNLDASVGKYYEEHKRFLTLDPEPRNLTEEMETHGFRSLDDYRKRRRAYMKAEKDYETKYKQEVKFKRIEQMGAITSDNYLLCLYLDGKTFRVPGEFRPDGKGYTYSNEFIPELPCLNNPDVDGKFLLIETQKEKFKAELPMQILPVRFTKVTEEVHLQDDIPNSGLYNESLKIETDRTFLDCSHPTHEKEDKWQDYTAEIEEKKRFASWIMTKKMFTKKMATLWMNRPVASDYETDVLQIFTTLQDDRYDTNTNYLICWPAKKTDKQYDPYDLVTKLEDVFETFYKYVQQYSGTEQYWEFAYALETLRDLLMSKFEDFGAAEDKMDADESSESVADEGSNAYLFYLRNFSDNNFEGSDDHKRKIEEAVKGIASVCFPKDPVEQNGLSNKIMFLFRQLPSSEPIKRLLDHPYFMVKYTHAVIKDGVTGNYYFMFNSETAFEFILKYDCNSTIKFDFVDDLSDEYDFWSDRLTQFVPSETSVTTNDNIDDEDLLWERVPATNDEEADRMQNEENDDDGDEDEMDVMDSYADEIKWLISLDMTTVVEWRDNDLLGFKALLQSQNEMMLSMYLDQKPSLMEKLTQKYRGACTFVYHRPLAAAHLCVEGEALTSPLPPVPTSPPPPAQSEGRKRGLSDAEIDKDEVFERMMRNVIPESSPLYALQQRMRGSDEAAALNELMESEELLQELMRVTKRRRAQLMLLLL